MRNFKWLTGDVNWQDYGGKWYRRVGKRGKLYHVITFSNWEDLIGSDAEGGPRYHCELDAVDLGDIPNETQRSALRSIGIDSEIPEDWGDPELVRMEACHSHGAKAPLWELSGNNVRKLLTEARQTSRDLQPRKAHAKAMGQRVNQLGSTAREYMKGDIQSGILRGLAEGKPEAELMLRLGVGFAWE
jgi:hypothetical protein